MFQRTHHDERDLRDLAEALFTSSRTGASFSGSDFEVLPTVTCGDPQAASLLALALAALPSPQEKTVILYSGSGCPTWGRCLMTEDLSDLEQKGVRAFVVLPPRDSPEVRALSIAAPRHLLYLTCHERTLGDLKTYLLALDMGATRGEVAWLSAPGAPEIEAAAVCEGWAENQGGRRTIHLGTWAPGHSLPPSAGDFLTQNGLQPGAWRWAWDLIARPK